MPVFEDHERFFEHLLRRNLEMFGAAFAIGAEDAVFLVGQLPNDAIDPGELDRILGSLYSYVERYPAGAANRVRLPVPMTTAL